MLALSCCSAPSCHSCWPLFFWVGHGNVAVRAPPPPPPPPQPQLPSAQPAGPCVLPRAAPQQPPSQSHSQVVGQLSRSGKNRWPPSLANSDELCKFVSQADETGRKGGARIQTPCSYPDVVPGEQAIRTRPGPEAPRQPSSPPNPRRPSGPRALGPSGRRSGSGERAAARARAPSARGSPSLR